MPRGDIELGREVVTQGYLSPQQLATCLQIQHKKRTSGEESSLKDIIVEQGLMSHEELTIIETNSNEQKEDQQTQIGKYTTIRELGRGGMGKVYLAKDNETQQEVGLKVLLNQEDNSILLRFLREAKATALLKHPGIVQVLDTGEHKGQHFFTMEYIAGQSLQSYIQSKKTIPTREALLFLQKIGHALHHAHQKGIIHRDIKPANIMLTQNKEPKVMDFGLAKVADASQKISLSGILIGTLYYMSPEQADGRNEEVDQQTDVYALGVVLYEMITGKLPFSGTGIGQVIQQILHKDPLLPTEINPKLPKSLDIICSQAMAKQKQHRYPNIPALLHDVRLCLQGQNVTPKFTPARRNSSHLIGIVVAGLLILTTLLFFAISSKSVQPEFIFQLVNEKNQPADTFQNKVFIEIDAEELADLSPPFTLEMYGEGVRYSKSTIKSDEFPLRYPVTLQDDTKTKFRLTSKISHQDKSWEEEILFSYYWPPPSLQIEHLTLKSGGDSRTYFYTNENIQLHFAWQTSRIRDEKITATLKGNNLKTQTTQVRVAAKQHFFPVVITGSPSQVTATLTLKWEQKQATKDITFLLYRKTSPVVSTDTNQQDEEKDIPWRFECETTDSHGVPHKNFTTEQPIFLTLKCNDGQGKDTSAKVRLRGKGVVASEQNIQIRKDHRVSFPIKLKESLASYDLHVEVQIGDKKYELPVSCTKEVVKPFEATVRCFQNGKRVQSSIVYGQPIAIGVYWKNLKSEQPISVQYEGDTFQKLEEEFTAKNVTGKKKLTLQWLDLVPDKSKFVFTIESVAHQMTKEFTWNIQKPKPKMESLKYQFIDYNTKQKISSVAFGQPIGLDIQWQVSPQKHGHQEKLKLTGKYIQDIEPEILSDSPKKLVFPLELKEIKSSSIKAKIAFNVGPMKETKNLSVKYRKDLRYYFHQKAGFAFTYPKTMDLKTNSEYFATIAIHAAPQIFFITDLEKPDGDGFRTFMTAAVVPLEKGVNIASYYQDKVEQEAKDFKQIGRSMKIAMANHTSDFFVYSFTQSKRNNGKTGGFEIPLAESLGKFNQRSYSGVIEKGMVGAYWLVKHKDLLFVFHLQSQKKSYRKYVKILNSLWKGMYWVRSLSID